MTITGINGKLRQGKGILMTKLALGIADSGGKVLSNYNMDSPNASTIDFYDMLYLLKQPRAKVHTTIVLDEIQTWLDSYVGQSKGGRFGSYFVFQSAKLGYDMIYTTQLTMRAQNTLRELADIRIYAKKDAKNKVFNYFLLDPNVTDDDVPTGCGFTISYSQASAWWNRYDTFEAVSPVGIDDIFMEMEKNDPIRMQQTIERQLNLLANASFYVEATNIGVKSALLDLQEPSVFSAIIAHRLKLLRQGRRKRIQQQKNPLTVEEKMREQWEVLQKSRLKA